MLSAVVSHERTLSKEGHELVYLLKFHSGCCVKN